MSQRDIDAYFGKGTTPRRVAEAIERAQSERPSRRPASTTERERFFKHIAEERKRAEAS